jgi:hypothetical protein
MDLMSGFMHNIIAFILFALTWHLLLKKIYFREDE